MRLPRNSKRISQQRSMNTSLDFGALLIPNVPQGFVPPSVQGNFISTAVFSIPIRSGQQQISGQPVTVSVLNSIPEPSTTLLLGSGLVGLIGYRRKKKA